MRRPVTIPIRWPASAGFISTPSIMSLPWTGLPPARTRANSAALVSRAVLGKRRRGLRRPPPGAIASCGAGGSALRPGCGARNELRRPSAEGACGHAGGGG
jgi:hypothetical protein